MKNNILLCTLLLLISACKQQNTASQEESIMPETFDELFDGMEKFGEYTITSYLNGYSEYHTVVFDTDAEARSDEKDYQNEYKKALKRDSILERNVKYLTDKYKDSAAKFYLYESHNGKSDSIECIIALRQLTDSTKIKDMDGELKYDFCYYPEFFHYEKHLDNPYFLDGTRAPRDISHYLTYHNSFEIKNKKKTDAQATKQLVLNWINKQKKVRQRQVSYLYDEGFATPRNECRIVSFSRNMDDVSRSYVSGVRYLIPASKENDKVKFLKELWSLFSDHVKNTYSNVDGHWGFECVRHEKFKHLHSSSIACLQMTIAKNRETGEMFHVQVGYDKNGIYLLLLDIHTKRFYIPANWIRIVNIHNDVEEWESKDFKYTNADINGETSFAKIKIVGQK